MRLFVVAATFGAVVFCLPAKARTPVLFDKPNLVVILTDDQTVDAIIGVDSLGRPFMPNVAAKLKSARRFSNTYFVESLCWPSRATLFTGMYPHNHGIADNDIPGGSFRKYMADNLDAKSWPMQMRAAGYYTGQFGKFLNGLNALSFRQTGKPEGWDYFFGMTSTVAGSMFNWGGVKNGKMISFTKAANGESGYMTNVLLDDMLAVMKRQMTGFKKPFAFVLSSTSPHLPAEASVLFHGLYANEPFQPLLKPSFNEADVTDKPTWLQATPRLTPDQIVTTAQQWRATLESARSVDRAFKMIWDQLEASGQLANTYIIFASDNGFVWGEHRLGFKVFPYEESIQSVTYVWGPGVKPGIDPRIVSNLDWFSTFTEIARGSVPDWVDGRSLLPLFRGESPGWRKTFLVQGFPPRDGATDSTGANFLALVTKDWKFIRYDNGEAEFYDLEDDPYEQTNIAPSLSPEFTAAVHQHIDALYACAGEACRTLENRRPPSR